jgi:S1-C subfamily serine protease
MLSYPELVRLATLLGGLPILGCLSGSPAEGAGMQYGDILLAVNGMPTASWDDFVRARSQAGDQLLARVFRQGVEFDVTIALRASGRSPLELVGELQDRGIFPGTERGPGEAGN